MADDLIEFLRRAAEQQARPPRTPEIEILDDDDEVEDAEIIDEGDALSSTGGLSSRHLDTTEFDQRTSKMGLSIDQSDDVMESHLRDVFEHELGQFGGRTSETAESVLDDDDEARSGEQQAETRGRRFGTGEFLQRLRNPDDLKRAIVLSEILARPEHRW
jgi:hypothetical protein